MRTITIRVESDKDAELLKQVLQATSFEDKIETFEEDEELDDQEIQMLEERWENYVKNPSSAISLEDFKKDLKENYSIICNL
jgi:hypothetical protein